MQHLGIEIQTKRDKTLSEQSFKLLKEFSFDLRIPRDPIPAIKS